LQIKLLTLDDDVPYTRQSIRNLKFYEPIKAVLLKAPSGISVKNALQVDEKKTKAATMDEVKKNMLDVYTKSVTLYIQSQNIFHVDQTESLPRWHHGQTECPSRR